ncbi:hypothetical protein PTTG_27302 [Puccinia triticina 1-1 BBBD Race 1]|uniref:Uncharacterized protein n=1 Tax=Puccinia triticina (isolate 1-1 / race 1 (BBBD)) TaxID=630390 RepID=A0A180GLY0_PUCT1|nr:hypothetical protein PTTG_27302 [Puccinia triticina 1-1 BBBD Race 1]
MDAANNNILGLIAPEVDNRDQWDTRAELDTIRYKNADDYISQFTKLITKIPKDKSSNGRFCGNAGQHRRNSHGSSLSAGIPMDLDVMDLKNQASNKNNMRLNLMDPEDAADAKQSSAPKPLPDGT